MSQHREYKGEQLVAITASTAHPIKVFEFGKDRPTRKVTAKEALLMFRAAEYVGFGSDTRIKFIRPVESSVSRPWQRCWRTERASVLPIWIEEAHA